MPGLKKIAKKEKIALEKMRESFLVEMKNLPDGTLVINKMDKYKYLRWYRQGRHSKNLSMKRAEDIMTAEGLRRKKFLQNMLKVIEKNIIALNRFENEYIELDPKSLFDELEEKYHIPPGKEREVLPGFIPHRADEAQYKSKSEEIIALVLERRGYSFMYECEIIANGKVYRPDFTILDPETNEYVYFEHMGLIEKYGYYKMQINKLIDYWCEDIRIDKNLILTFETEDMPLTMAQVESALDNFFAK